MKKIIRFGIVIFAFVLYCNTSMADSYTWRGAVSSVWNASGNWKDNTTGLNTNYPGFGVNDVATIATTVTITLGVNLNISSISISSSYNPTINVANGVTLTVTSGITVNEGGFLAQASLTAEAANVAGTGTGIIAVGGTSSINANCYLINEGALQFTSGAVVNFSDILSTIENYTGTLKATSTTFNFSNYAAQINNNNGGTVTATGCMFNITAANYFVALGAPITGIVNEYGTFNILGSSVVNLSGSETEIYNYSNTANTNNGVATLNITSSIVNLSGTYTELYNYNNYTGSTFNITSSTINLSGSNSEIYNDDNNDATVGGIATYTSKYVVTSSTINLGTLVSNGSASSIVNTDEGFFYLNAGSVINLTGPNTKINNVPFQTTSPFYYGVFICASTSVINPSSSSCTISNTTTVGGTTSNPANCFTLLSDASGSATIGTDNSATGNITGQFNVQRYVTGGASNYRNYRLLSCPVNAKSATPASTNYVNLAYLSATTTLDYITGNYYGAFVAGPGASFGGGIHQITNPLIYLYQESITPGSGYNSSFTSGKNVGVTTYSSGVSPYYLGTTSTATGGITSASVLLPPGNGYLLYYIDNNQRSTVASAQSTPNSSTISATGYLNQSNIPLYMWGTAPSATLTYTTTPAALVRLPGLIMIGNPYPASLDLYKFYTGNGGILTGTFYELNDATQQFPTYNAVTNTTSGASGGSEYVASGQGFYILTSGAGALTFKENQKATSTTGPVVISPILESRPIVPGTTVDNLAIPANIKIMNDAVAVSSKPKHAQALNNAASQAIFYRIDGSNPQAVANRLLVVKKAKATLQNANNNNPGAATSSVAVNTGYNTTTTTAKPVPTGLHLKLVKDSINVDECGIYFNKAWSDNFDTNDSKDLDGLAGQVYLSSYSADKVRTSINAMGNYAVTGGKHVMLYVKFATTGIYQLQLSDIIKIDTSNYSVFLLDNMLKDSLDLTLYKSYNFNYTPGTANDSTRFVLAIEHKPVPYYALLTFAGEKVTPGVQLNWQTKNNGNNTTFVLQKLNASNVYVPIDSLQSDSSGEFSYIDQHPTLGNNTYRLQQTSELGKITYSAPVTIGYNSTSPNGGLTIYPNPSRDIITVTLSTSSIATTVATADIYNMSGTLIEHKAVSSNSFTHDISSYQLGVYIIELKNSNGVLVGKSKFVKVQ